VAVVLDSAPIIAFLDRGDALHSAADEVIRDLVGKHRLYASSVTLAEVLVGAHLDHHDEAIVRGFFADLVSEVLPVEAADAERAARIRAAQRSLRMPDALILAAAETHPEVDLLLTGDAALASVRGLDCRVSLLGPPA
jgi:predicted nucleic acid-binding protein